MPGPYQVMSLGSSGAVLLRVVPTTLEAESLADSRPDVVVRSTEGLRLDLSIRARKLPPLPKRQADDEDSDTFPTTKERKTS